MPGCHPEPYVNQHELPSLDGWIRRRLRCIAWVQWKTRGQRYRELRRLNVPERSARAAIFSPKGPWRLSFSEALHRGFTKARFRRLGLLPMEKPVVAESAEPPWYGPVCPVVWGASHRDSLLPAQLGGRLRRDWPDRFVWLSR